MKKRKLRHWTPEKILRIIEYRSSKGWPLNANHVQDHCGGLYIAAVRHLGSWQNALAKAGIDYRSVYKQFHGIWNKKSVVQAIRKKYRAGEPMNYQHVLEHQGFLLSAAIKKFGAWRKAVLAAGISYQDVAVKRLSGYWNERSFKRAVRKMYEEGEALNPGYIMKRHAGMFGFANRTYGSWRKALFVIGIKDYDNVLVLQQWTKAKVIKCILKRWKEVKSLDQKELEKEDMPLFGAAQKYFGSTVRALLAAGLDPNTVRTRKRWTRANILAELRDLVFADHEPIDAGSLLRRHPSLLSAINKHCGGLRNAFAMLGLEPKKYLLADLPIEDWVRSLSNNEFARVIKETQKMIAIEQRKEKT